MEAFTYPVAMRLNPRFLPFKHRFQLAINVFLALPALVVVLATGSIRSTSSATSWASSGSARRWRS